MISFEKNHLYRDITQLYQQAPLIHNVSNFVAMNTVANVLLAIGASPLMAHAEEELAEIVNMSAALVINIGTLDPTWIAAMRSAQRWSLQKSIPIILDPVGAGASILRTRTALSLLQDGVDILRGNPSEIMALTNDTQKSRGVDSAAASENAINAAQRIACQYHCVVVISGHEDYIIDESNVVKISHGTSLFTKVTAMGCALSAVIGAFSAINPDYFNAAIHAVIRFTMAGEKVANNAAGPGSFYRLFLDELYKLPTNEPTHINIFQYS